MVGFPFQGIDLERVGHLMSTDETEISLSDLPDLTDPETANYYGEMYLRTHGTPPPPFPTLDQVREETRQRSKNIFESWFIIKRILAPRGDNPEKMAEEDKRATQESPSHCVAGHVDPASTGYGGSH
ncbi:hypothetical protein AWENTII_001943 [Aspergillus wentii]